MPHAMTLKASHLATGNFWRARALGASATRYAMNNAVATFENWSPVSVKSLLMPITAAYYMGQEVHEMKA